MIAEIDTERKIATIQHEVLELKYAVKQLVATANRHATETNALKKTRLER